MTNPMYCPMSFANSEFVKLDIPPVECTPDCAWAMEAQGRYFCAVPAKVATWVERINSSRVPTEINTRPLEDDAE